MQHCFFQVDTVLTFDRHGVSGHKNHASIYNAMPMQGVEKLVAFMKDFQAKH